MTESPPPVRRWEDDEPGLSEIGHELRCIRARARARIGWVLALSLLAAALLTALEGLRPRLFSSSIVLSVQDENPDLSQGPATARELAEHLRTVALSRTSLLRIMEQLGLYESWRKVAPDLAIEEMRGRTEIEVRHDSFSGINQELTRSTHVAVTYADEDPETALAIVRTLGRMIAKMETDTRQSLSHGAAAAMENPESELLADLAESERLASELRHGLSRLSARERMTAEIELRRATNRNLELSSQLRSLRVKHTALALKEEAQKSAAGLTYEWLDRGEVAPPPRLAGRERTALLAGVAFFVLFPVVSMLVGLIDSRVRSIDDLRRLGIKAVGHVPSFQGQDVGSLQARMNAKKGV